MSRRLVFGGIVALLCIVAVAFAGALFSAALAPETASEKLAEEHGFGETELEKLGSEANPIKYGGTDDTSTEVTDRYGPVAQPYWRTATYDHYTGSTWQLTDDATENGSVDPHSADTEQYAIETWGLSDAVPSPSGTIAVSEATAEKLQQLPDGSLRATTELSPGSTLAVEREQRAWEYDDFDAVSYGYPEEYERYTDVPEAVSSRVSEIATEITEDTESPYVAAILLERWLLDEKEYAVDVAQTEESLIEEFLFEQDEGTSEYFATAFATLARTQDIPARYVTGFAPGEETDDGQEAVRGIHAHAWVELYFEDVGWVTVDPTPADHIEQRTAETGDSVDAITMSEQLTQTDTTTDTSDTPVDPSDRAGGLSKLHQQPSLLGDGFSESPLFRSDDQWEPVDDNYSADFLDEPAPGSTATLQVTQHGNPLSDHRISVDGKQAGITDANGQLAVDIPYTDEITVTVYRYTGDGTPEDESDEPEDEQPGENESTDSGLGALNPGEEAGVGGDVGFDPETYGNSDTSVHFTVESEEPAYWRTDVYDEYTGEGWQQTDESVPSEATDQHAGETIEYTVRLEQAATALPTVWRPDSLSGVDAIEVTDESAIHTEEPLSAGTEYTGVSIQPDDDVETLRTADEVPPEAVRERYTQRPSDEPERIEELTAEIVDGEQTTYDKAMAVQEWLRTEKEYSLDVGTTSEQIADTFIFEMDAGYCEYFATAMVSMLRSQDIPTRYAVGYATGEEVAEDTYEVRGMHAHSWVEVYFPAVGWVQFDPTPGDDRLSDEQTALESNDDRDDPTLASTGSPGESFSTSGIERETDAIVDQDDYEVGGYADHLSVPTEITIGDEPAPQSDQLRFLAESTEKDDMVPIADLSPATVSPGSATSFSEGMGLLSGTEVTEERWYQRSNGYSTPFIARGERSFTSSMHECSGPDDTGERANLENIGGLVFPGQDDRFYSYSRVTDTDHAANSVSPLFAESGETTISLESNLSVSTGNETTPGASLTVETTIADTPVPDATNELYASEKREELLETARTNDSGQATVALPATESAVIVAERGSLSGSSSHEINPELNITFLDDPIPGTDVSLAVTSNETPVPAFPVTLSAAGANDTAEREDVEGRTDEDGVANLTVPFAEEFTATVEGGEYVATDTANVTPELSVSSAETPGDRVTVSATADGEPLSGLSVSPGEEETGDDGAATISLPFTEETDITATRGAIELSETTSLDGDFEVQIDGQPLPGTSVMATVTIDGEPVENADIFLDGNVEGVTAEDGTASLSLPVDPTVSGEIEAVRGEKRSETTVPVQYGWGAVSGLILVALGIAFWRGNPRAWLSGSRSFSDVVLTAYIRLVVGLHRLAIRLLTGIRPASESDPLNESRHAENTSSPTVRHWRRFVNLVDALPSDTPADIARRAVNAGLPAGPVRRIVTLYRSYRYGADSSATSEELEQAVSTVEREANE